MLPLIRFRHFAAIVLHLLITITRGHSKFTAQFLGFASLNIETQWVRYLPEVKIGSRTSIL